jgi:phage terminase large subunit
MKVNWSDNPWFPDVLRAEKDALFKRDPESYRNIWEGECRSAVEGAIYSREVATLYEEKRFRPVPHDPLLAVHTVWDLGWNDQMSIILAQRTASEIRIIEYIEDSHRTLAEYVSDLDRKPYKWGKDWLPHDGRAKDYKSGRSAEEILQALRRDVQIVPEIGVEAGIKAARLIFGRTFFDETRAERLVHCLKRYRRTINQTTNEPGPPLHDEFSHGADAFRYLGVIADQMKNDGNDLGDYYKAFRRYG